MASPTAATRSFWTSTIGLKWIMGLTGAGLAGFVAFHMLSHLQVLSGADQYNAYAEFMYGLGGLLWVARAGLLGILVLHIWAAATLNKRNREARPSRYSKLRHQVTSPYALIMMISGVVVLVFIVYHLMHFTFGAVHTQYFDAEDALGRRDVYTNFVKSFQNPLIVGAYVVGNALLGAHLAHAMSSMFRTLGASVGRYRPIFDKFGPVFAVVVVIGYISMPLAVLLGIVSI